MTMSADELLWYCRVCQRETLQRNAHDCLDATRFVCSVCDGSEVVPESIPYGRDRD